MSDKEEKKPSRQSSVSPDPTDEFVSDIPFDSSVSLPPFTSDDSSSISLLPDLPSDDSSIAFPSPGLSSDSPVVSSKSDSPVPAGAEGGVQRPRSFETSLEQKCSIEEREVSPDKWKSCREREQTPMHHSKSIVKPEKAPVKKKTPVKLGCLPNLHLFKKSPRKRVEDDQLKRAPEKYLDSASGSNIEDEKVSPDEWKSCREREQTPMHQSKDIVKKEKTPVKKVKTPVDCFPSIPGIPNIFKKSPRKMAADDQPKPATEKYLDSASGSKVDEKVSPDEWKSCREREQTPMHESKIIVKKEKTSVKKEKTSVKLSCLSGLHIFKKSPRKMAADDQPMPAAETYLDSASGSKVEDEKVSPDEWKSCREREQTPMHQSKNIVKKQETSVKKQETSVKKQETSVKKQETSVKKQETSVKKQETSVKKEETSVKKESTPVREKTPVKRVAEDQLKHAAEKQSKYEDTS